MPQTAQEPLMLQDDASQGISPGEILRMLWRHKFFILLCTLACFGLALGYLAITHRVYESTATVRIDPGRTGSLGLSDLGAGSSGDTSDIVHTEIAIMESNSVALRTLRELPDDDFQALAGESKKDADLPETLQDLTPEQADLVEGFESSLVIKQQEGANLVNISYRNGNPRLAADVANHLISAYFVQSFVDRDRSVSQLNGWLSSQMATLRKQVDVAQRQLTAFEEKNNVMPTDNSASNSITDRLRQVSERLTSAQSDRILKEGQLRAAQKGDLAALSALFPTSRLQGLQAEATTLFNRDQQLRSKFGPNYPPLAEADKQLKAINSEIPQELQAIRGRLQQEYNAAKTVEDLLRQQYDEQTAIAFAFDRHEAEYAALQADVSSARTLYDTLSHKLQQASVDAQINGLNTLPVDYAFAPSYPIAPKRPLILGGSLALGLIAGIAAALLMELTSDKLLNVAQLGKVAPYPVLSAIPALGSTRRNGSSTGDAPLVTTDSSGTVAAEAYRTLRNLLLLEATEHPLKSILFAAPSAREHVGELAANTAVALAQANKRVLLIDADLQDPSLHRYFRAENKAGLSDVLLGGDTRNAFQQPLPDLQDLYLLTTGSSTAAIADYLVQEPFAQALRTWQANFDFVLLKTAPPAQQSSGLLLAHRVDQVLIDVRYQDTQLRTLRELHTLLDRARAKVLGVVVENLPRSK